MMINNNQNKSQNRHLLESKRRIDYHKNSRHSSVRSPNQDLYSARKATGSNRRSPINGSDCYKRTVYHFDKKRSDMHENKVAIVF